MKRTLILTIIALVGFPIVSSLCAQEGESLRERLARRQQAQEQATRKGDPQLTTRAQIMNEAQTKDIADVTWMREVYRFIDMDNDKNAALYYPVKPIGDRTNFFTMIFNKVLEGEVDVYKFQIDGSERFSEEYKQPIDSSFFYTFDIPFSVENGKYVVEPDAVPSEEVRGYYMKETWYFDKNNSVVDIKTVAVCPVMIYQGYDTGMERHPLFWVPYENIRPYASRMPIMVSSLNNASTQTINDFFVKHNFDGEIYKTTNMRNLTLAVQFDHPDSLKKEQKKIEKQLKDFKDNLWVYNDSIAFTGQANEKVRTVKKAKVAKGDSDSSSSSGSANDRAQVQREAKQQSTSPTRSMRNRKRY